MIMHRLMRTLHVRQRTVPFLQVVRNVNHSTRADGAGLPSAASLDSVQSDSPHHFYQTKILQDYIDRPVNASTLRQYIFFGRHMTDDRLIQAANFVRTELAVRLAHRIRDFQRIPFFIGTNPHIEFIYRLYWGTFEKIRNYPPITTVQENEQFCELLRQLLEDGQLAVPRMALGVSECAAYCHGTHDLNRFVNRLLRSRISRRVLAEQHIALTDAYNQGWDLMGEGEGYVGIIFVRCSAKDVMTRTTALVEEHARAVYHKDKSDTAWQPPEIHVDLYQDQTGVMPQPKDDIVFTYIPEQLELILFELLSNAVRFTMTHHTSGEYPPIQVTVCANETDVYFRVSDQGGGMPPERYAHLWSYQDRAPDGEFRHFSQVDKVSTNMKDRADQAAYLGSSHLGMGLAISRTYAEYWGGELQIMTLEGYGTDAYARIPRLGTKIEDLCIDQDIANQNPTEEHDNNNNKTPFQRQTPSITQNPLPIPHDGEGWTKSNMVRD